MIFIMNKIMHVINIKCDKKTYQIDITDFTNKEIKAKIKEVWIKGINFIKIIKE